MTLLIIHVGATLVAQPTFIFGRHDTEQGSQLQNLLALLGAVCMGSQFLPIRQVLNSDFFPFFDAPCVQLPLSGRKDGGFQPATALDILCRRYFFSESTSDLSSLVQNHEILKFNRIKYSLLTFRPEWIICLSNLISGTITSLILMWSIPSQSFVPPPYSSFEWISTIIITLGGLAVQVRTTAPFHVALSCDINV